MSPICGIVCGVFELIVAVLLVKWIVQRWTKLNNRIYTLGHELGVLKVVRKKPSSVGGPPRAQQQSPLSDLPERRQTAR